MCLWLLKLLLVARTARATHRQPQLLAPARRFFFLAVLSFGARASRPSVQANLLLPAGLGRCCCIIVDRQRFSDYVHESMYSLG